MIAKTAGESERIAFAPRPDILKRIDERLSWDVFSAGAVISLLQHARAEIADLRAKVNGVDPSVDAPTVEIENTAQGFRFRLVSGDKVTEWCGYSQIAMLNGYAAATGYYVGDDALALKPLLPSDLLAQFAVGEAHPEQPHHR